MPFLRQQLRDLRLASSIRRRRLEEAEAEALQEQKVQEAEQDGVESLEWTREQASSSIVKDLLFWFVLLFTVDWTRVLFQMMKTISCKYALRVHCEGLHPTLPPRKSTVICHLRICYNNMCTSMYVCMYVCMYVGMYVCMY